MVKDLNVGLIGLGRMGAEPSSRLEGKVPSGWLPLTHAEVIQSIKGLNLIALCDQDPERLDKMSNRYGVSKTYLDYKKLIDDNKPDIISLATRTEARCEIIEYAVTHGVKGIFAEKPLARSVKECKRTIDAVTLHDAVIAFGATRRGMSIYRKAKQIIKSGELGDLVQISIEFGKAALLWTLPHAMDLILLYADSTALVSVNGVCEFNRGDYNEIDHVLDTDPTVLFAYFQFENGISSTISQTPGFNVRLACNKGILTIHGDGEYITLNKPGKVDWYFHDEKRVTTDNSTSGSQFIFEDIKRSILSGDKLSIIQPEEIITNQLMLSGIVASALRGGALVKAHEIDHDLAISGRQGDVFA